jgi:hypothetical protein
MRHKSDFGCLACFFTDRYAMRHKSRLYASDSGVFYRKFSGENIFFHLSTVTARRETSSGCGSGNAENLAVIIGGQMEAEIKFLSPIWDQRYTPSSRYVGVS